jgi:hypothetical protein
MGDGIINISSKEHQTRISVSSSPYYPMLSVEAVRWLSCWSRRDRHAGSQRTPARRQALTCRVARRAVVVAQPPGIPVMEIDTDKIDEAVLALLYLTLHDDVRAWKGFDWDAMDRLHRKGLIRDPVGKAKSVVLTEEGLAESKRLFIKLFAKLPAPAPSSARSGL